MKSTFLKVMAIITLIFGIIGAIGGAVAAAGMGTLGSMFGVSVPMTGTIIGIIGAILMIVAGAIGIGASSKPEKAGKAVVWGIILIVINVISLIVGIAESSALISELTSSLGVGDLGISTVSWTNFTGLILPILYFVAAFLFKKKVSKI